MVFRVFVPKMFSSNLYFLQLFPNYHLFTYWFKFYNIGAFSSARCFELCDWQSQAYETGLLNPILLKFLGVLGQYFGILTVITFLQLFGTLNNQLILKFWENVDFFYEKLSLSEK